jgi:hypothetical protein
MIMQPYPLWVVLEDMKGELTPGMCLVIGWEPNPEDTSGYSAVLVPIVSHSFDWNTSIKAAEFGDDMMIHVCQDQKDAGKLRSILGKKSD